MKCDVGLGYRSDRIKVYEFDDDYAKRVLFMFINMLNFFTWKGKAWNW